MVVNTIAQAIRNGIQMNVIGIGLWVPIRTFQHTVVYWVKFLIGIGYYLWFGGCRPWFVCWWWQFGCGWRWGSLWGFWLSGSTFSTTKQPTSIKGISALSTGWHDSIIKKNETDRLSIGYLGNIFSGISTREVILYNINIYSMFSMILPFFSTFSGWLGQNPFCSLSTKSTLEQTMSYISPHLFLLQLFALAICSRSVFAQNEDCRWVDSVSGISYDLTALRNNQRDYHIPKGATPILVRCWWFLGYSITNFQLYIMAVWLGRSILLPNNSFFISPSEVGRLLEYVWPFGPANLLSWHWWLPAMGSFKRSYRTSVSGNLGGEL